MNAFLLVAAGAYVVYAILNIPRRPGIFGSVILCTFGLAVFFGPIGTAVGVVALLASIAAVLINKPAKIIFLPSEVALIIWVAFMAFLVPWSQLYTPMRFMSLLFGLSLITFIYARTFATRPGFVGHLYWGAIVGTCITFFSLNTSPGTFNRLGENADSGVNAVGIASMPESVFVCSLAYLLFNSQATRRAKAVSLTFLILVALPFLIETETRSALLSCGSVLLLFLAIYFQRAQSKRLRTIGLASVGLSAIVGLAIAFSQFNPNELSTHATERFFDQSSGGFLSDASSRQRLYLISLALDWFRAFPIFGAGPGFLGETNIVDYPHNLEIELLELGGIVGLCLFMWFLVPILIKAVRGFLKAPFCWEQTAVTGMLLSTFIRHQFSFSVASGKTLFFMLGCTAAWHVGKRAKARVTAPGTAQIADFGKLNSATTSMATVGVRPTGAPSRPL